MSIPVIDIHKLMIRAQIASRVGPEGYCLISVIAIREDELRGFERPRFWLRNLMDSCGVGSKKRMMRIRDECIANGYIEYISQHRAQGEYWIAEKILLAISQFDVPLVIKTHTKGTLSGHQATTKGTSTDHPSTPILSLPREDTQISHETGQAVEDAQFMDLWGWLKGSPSERFDPLDPDYINTQKIRNDDLAKMDDIHKRCTSLLNDSFGYDDIAKAWMTQMQMEFFRKDPVSGSWFIQSFLKVMNFSMVTDLLMRRHEDVLRVHNEYSKEYHDKKERLGIK